MVNIKIIEGKSISHVKGFQAIGAHVGLKKSGKKDMALIYSEVPAVCAASFTKNVVKAAPVIIDMEQVKNPTMRGIIINSGNANACTGRQGMEDGYAMINKVAELLKITPEEVMIYSTGVIGVPMPMDVILKGAEICVEKLVSQGQDDAHIAIMTTDTKEKIIFIEIELDGKPVSLCGIAKGSGMIHPNMGTMLSYVVTDAAITKELLTKIQQESVEKTYNMVSVDGDTSTNDTSTLVANGCAGNSLIDKENEDFQKLKEAVDHVNEYLAKAVAADGEGASRLIEVDLVGGADLQSARICAKTVVSSSLVKSAIHGADANWGRILCAMGYSGSEFDPMKVDVSFSSEAGSVEVFDKGVPIQFDEEIALKVLTQPVIVIHINMNAGNVKTKAWGCDLSAEYVRINGSYRS